MNFKQSHGFRPALLVIFTVCLGVVFSLGLGAGQHVASDQDQQDARGQAEQPDPADYLMSEKVQEMLRQDRERDAASSDPLIRYMASDTFQQDSKRLEAQAGQWSPEEFEHRWAELANDMRNEAMWAMFLEHAYLAELASRDPKRIAAWKPYAESLTRLSVIAVGTNELTIPPSPIIENDSSYLCYRYGQIKAVYPHMKARRESLVRQIMLEIYNVQPNSPDMIAWKIGKAPNISDVKEDQ